MFLLPFLLQMLGANGAVAGALGSMGLGSGIASALAPAITSGLGTWAATGDASKGLTAGLTGGLTAGLGGMLGGGADAASGAANAATAANGANAAGSAAAMSPGAAAQAASAAQIAQAAGAGAMTQDPTRFAGLGSMASTANAAPAASGGGMGGMLPWLIGGAAMLPSLFGGKKDDGSNSPPYQHATPVSRHVVGVPSQGTGTLSPSTYLPGDTSQNGTIWRYGQQGGPETIPGDPNTAGGEHMWFDVVPNSSRPTLDPVDDGSSGSHHGHQARPTIMVDMPNMGRFSFASGGLANCMAAGGQVKGPKVGVPMPMGPMAPPMTPDTREPTHLFDNGGMVFGPGTGRSDSIPARLSDGEFVVPADVVAHLGAGSNKAGGQELSDMMQRVRLAAQQQKQPRSMGLKVQPG